MERFKPERNGPMLEEFGYVWRLPHVGTRNFGSSALRNPLPKSPCVGEERRACLAQTLPTGSPTVGSRVSPVQKILRSTSLHPSGADTYDLNAVSPCSSALSSPGGAAMSGVLGERTQPRYAVPLPHRVFSELVISLKKTPSDSP